MRLFETEHKQPLIFSPTQNATAKFQLHLLPCAFAEKLDWRNFGKKWSEFIRGNNGNDWLIKKLVLFGEKPKVKTLNFKLIIIKICKFKKLFRIFIWMTQIASGDSGWGVAGHCTKQTV